MFDSVRQRNRYIRQLCLEVAFFAVLLAIDLISKAQVFAFLEGRPSHSFVVEEGIFTFYRVENYGMSFGLLSGQKGLLLAISSIISLGMLALLIFTPSAPKNFRVPMWMIIAGAVGNIVDRAAFGYVRDFIDYTFLKTFFNIDFAIGNIADLFVLLGVILLLVYIVFEFDESHFASLMRKKSPKVATEPTSDADATMQDADASSEDREA